MRFLGNAAPAAPQNAGASGIPPGMMVQQDFPDILDPTIDGADFFFYQTVVAPLTHATSSSSSINVDAGTDFLWIATTYFPDIAGAAVTSGTIPVPNVTLVIQDTGATKNLMNGPVPISAIAGTGNFPYRLPKPRLFRANSVINFTWTSYEASVDYAHIYLMFHGMRLPSGSFNLQS